MSQILTKEETITKVKELIDITLKECSIGEDNVDILRVWKAFKTQKGFGVLKFTVADDPILKEASPNVEYITGYSVQEGLGKKVSELVKAPLPLIERMQFVAKLRKGKVVAKVQEIIRKDKTITNILGLVYLDVTMNEIVELIIDLGKL